MYSTVLLLHSWLRWVALILGVAATGAALVGRSSSSGPADGLGRFFVIVLDVQLLLGLALYFGLSPTTAAAMNDFGAAMRDPVLRFWAVEHAAAMVLAVILAHVGNVLARKAASPASKRTKQILFFGLATVLMIARTPWPGMPNGRPLFRLP